MTMMKKLVTISAVLLLSACATQPVQQTPVPAAPTQWMHAQNEKTAAFTVTQDWWRSFGSAELDALIAAAQTESLDVAASIARVEQARATAHMAGAALLPELSAGLDAQRVGRLGGNGEPTGTSYGAGLSARYEIDFWGRNHAVRDQAGSLLRAAEFARDTVRLTVTASAANLWLQSVGLRERTVIGERSLASAQRLLDMVESRARAGAATPLELAQQRGVVAAQQRTLAAIRQQANDSRTALAVLLGRNTSELNLVAADLDVVQAPVVGAGLPADLLGRRPDIARAEAELIAADANIAAARAAMFPSLFLTAGIDASSGRSSTLFDNPLYNVAAGLTAPIFNAGRLAAGRDLAVAQREELLAIYRQAIAAAFGDVETALNAVAGIEAQRVAQEEEVRQAQRALTLAESRYRAGAETSLTLLDAQRTLYAAQDAAAQLHTARLQAAVSLYRALGGGWQLPSDEAAS
jgi:NodT family efflux transporter outer membrane factor (OMF) lipoprotein